MPTYLYLEQHSRQQEKIRVLVRKKRHPFFPGTPMSGVAYFNNMRVCKLRRSSRRLSNLLVVDNMPARAEGKRGGNRHPLSYTT